MQWKKAGVRELLTDLRCSCSSPGLAESQLQAKFRAACGLIYLTLFWQWSPEGLLPASDGQDEMKSQAISSHKLYVPHLTVACEY